MADAYPTLWKIATEMAEILKSIRYADYSEYLPAERGALILNPSYVKPGFMMPTEALSPRNMPNCNIWLNEGSAEVEQNRPLNQLPDLMAL